MRFFKGSAQLSSPDAKRFSATTMPCPRHHGELPNNPSPATSPATRLWIRRRPIHLPGWKNGAGAVIPRAPQGRSDMVHCSVSRLNDVRGEEDRGSHANCRDESIHRRQRLRGAGIWEAPNQADRHGGRGSNWVFPNARQLAARRRVNAGPRVPPERC